MSSRLRQSIVSLQHLAARFCRMRALRGACRSCYRILAGALGLLFRSLPSVRAAYLAGSMATDDPEPGLSDIDFVLVVADLPCEAEYRLVRRIERLLRYTMPPWGRPKVGPHVIIYARREWRLVSDLFLGKRYGVPKTVFDKDAAHPAYHVDEATKGLHHVYKALWRLEGVQTALWNHPKSELERRLCARMADRMLHSIRNAFGEFRMLPGDTNGRQARHSTGEHAPANPGPATGANVLPGLLRALDDAVSACIEPAANDPRLAPGGIRGFTDRETAAAIDGPAGSAEDVSMWVASMDCADLVVLESNDCPNATDTFLRMTNAGGRQPFLVTTTVFERLYLNAPCPTWNFTRLPEGTTHTIAGAYTRTRAFVDAYAVFPKLRSLVGCDDPDQYDSVRATIENLTGYFEALTGEDPVLHGRDRESPGAGPASRAPLDPMLAFRQLHDRAARLVRVLSEYLETEARAPSATTLRRT